MRRKKKKKKKKKNADRSLQMRCSLSYWGRGGENRTGKILCR
jgi:hypothetical protein